MPTVKVLIIVVVAIVNGSSENKIVAVLFSVLVSRVNTKRPSACNGPRAVQLRV